MTDVIDIRTRRVLDPKALGKEPETAAEERVVYELEDDTDRSLAIAPDGGLVVVMLNTDPAHSGGTPAALVMDPITATELGVALIESAHTARRLAAARQAAPKGPPKG